MKKLAMLAVFLALPLMLMGQINAPQMTFNYNFLGTGVYGGSAAMSAAFMYQDTAAWSIRVDYLSIPGSSYNGYSAGGQYNLCGIPAYEKLFQGGALNCSHFSTYAGGSAGLGSLSGQYAPTYAGYGGFYYDPTGTGTFQIIPTEVGWRNFGPKVAGQSNQGVYWQAGILAGLGTSAEATMAKRLFFAHHVAANAKMLKKINDAIQKANQS